MATVLAVVLSAAAAGALVPWSTSVERARLARLLPSVPAASARDRPGPMSLRNKQRLAGAVAGCTCVLIVGGVVGLVLGLVVAASCDRGLRRLEPRARRRRRERLAADLPVAADLLAGCLLAGSTMEESVESVAVAVGGPLEEVLRGVTASIRLGADPAPAWLAIAGEPVLEPLARTVSRAVSSGAPVAEAMARLADDQRSELRRAAAAAAGRVGVRAAMPLGLCFLPAFVLLGVVPVVGEIARQVVSG